MKIASPHTTSIRIAGLTEPPDEFKSIPAMEYHRPILLHARYRKEVEAIPTRPPQIPPPAEGSFFGVDPGALIEASTRQPVVDAIRKGAPPNYESLTSAVKTCHNVKMQTGVIGNLIGFILDKPGALSLTVQHARMLLYGRGSV